MHPSVAIGKPSSQCPTVFRVAAKPLPPKYRPARCTPPPGKSCEYLGNMQMLPPLEVHQSQPTSADVTCSDERCSHPSLDPHGDRRSSTACPARLGKGAGTRQCGMRYVLVALNQASPQCNKRGPTPNGATAPSRSGDACAQPVDHHKLKGLKTDCLHDDHHKLT